MSWEMIDMPPISEWKDHPKQKWFKAKGDNGAIYRVQNPAHNLRWETPAGHVWVRRIKPQLIEGGAPDRRGKSKKLW